MTSIERFEMYTIPVETINNESYLHRAICEIVFNRSTLKKNIFKTDLYAYIYNNTINIGNIDKNIIDHNVYLNTYTIFNTHLINIYDTNKQLITDILSSMFSASFAVCYCHSKGDIFVLLPWLWHHFLLCNPKVSYSIVADKHDIVTYIFDNYMDLTIEINHYS